MFNISNFLDKFTKLHKSNEYIKQTLKALIKEISGVDLTTADLDLKESGVYLKCSPLFRNQIFMYKEKIENSLKSQKIFLKIY